MPRHCCVPGCKTNCCSELKSTSYRSVFGYPKNEGLKSKWLTATSRKNWSLSKESFVCSSHFCICEIVTAETVLLDALHHTVPLKFPKLLEGSVPSIFPNFAALSNKASTS
nr:unnamed protein product [Callosobruchus analis]